jgi:ribosomal protein L7Ae-like RNA K-turn-binding protein
LGGAVSTPDLSLLIGSIRERVSSRIDGLLASAGRARKVAIGAVDTGSALSRHTAALVILATDLSPRVRSNLEDAARRQNIVVSDFGDKERLGFALARSEVGAVALTDPGFAETVSLELRMLDGISTTQVQNETSRQRVEALERAT